VAASITIRQYQKPSKVLKDLLTGDLRILKSLKDSPKSSIDIAYIHHIKADQRTPTQFEIEFEAKHMM
jgi:hypothetical protein